jgi:hypothetical protein
MRPQLIGDNALGSRNRDFLMPWINEIFSNRSIRQATDAQGQYYTDAIEERNHTNKPVFLLSPVRKQKRIRRKKLIEGDIKLALSIVGIIEDGLEPDLSENFREYFYKNE